MLQSSFCATLRQFLFSCRGKSKGNHIQNSDRECTKVKTETEAVVLQN